MATTKEARRSFEELTQQCFEWNRIHPIGTPVTVRNDDDSLFDTETAGFAFVRHGRVPVIYVKGVFGCYLLDRVRTRFPKPQEAPCR